MRGTTNAVNWAGGSWPALTRPPEPADALLMCRRYMGKIIDTVNQAGVSQLLGTAALLPPSEPHPELQEACLWAGSLSGHDQRCQLGCPESGGGCFGCGCWPALCL